MKRLTESGTSRPDYLRAVLVGLIAYLCVGAAVLVAGGASLYAALEDDYSTVTAVTISVVYVAAAFWLSNKFAGKRSGVWVDAVVVTLLAAYLFTQGYVIVPTALLVVVAISALIVYVARRVKLLGSVRGTGVFRAARRY